MAKVNLVELYKSLNDKPLHEQGTYGDLSPEEWEAEREKMGMKTDDEGNQYIDFKYDPGNEPLEIQMLPDQGEYANKIFYIEPEDIEAYVNGEDVEAIRPDAGFGEPDEVTANRQNSDVTNVGEEELEDFIASSRGGQSADDLNENEDNLKKAIIDVLKKEGGAAGLEPILNIAKKLGVTKNKIKKILNSIGKIKKHTNGDYILTPINERKNVDEELDKKTIQVAKAFGKKGGEGKNASLNKLKKAIRLKSPGAQITEKDLDVRSKAIEKRKTLIKNKLKGRFQELAGIKSPYGKETLNEIEYCDPNETGACGEGKECTYINSAFQYQCCPGGAGCPEAQISTNTGKGDVQALSPKRKKSNKPVRRKSMMNLRRMKNM